MSKRFTDTDKWKDPFIKSLEAKYKLLWFYILDDCDHAGVWIVDIDVAGLRCGFSYDESESKKIFASRIQEINGGSRWFVRDFVDFQYGRLNPENRAHNSVLSILEKHNIKPLISPLQGAKDKEQDKEKDKAKEKEPILLEKNSTLADGKKLPKVPTLEEVLEYFDQKGYTEESAKKAFSYYNDPMIDSGGRVWKDGKGNTVKLWKQKMIGVWFKPENAKSNLSEKDQERLQKACKWATDSLNSLLDTNYTTDEPNTVKAITARLLEGHTHGHFKKVLDKKVAEWKGTEMQKNLQPHILFGNKFSAYLEQPEFSDPKAAPKSISISTTPYSK